MVQIIINSYQREKMLNTLLRQLKEAAKSVNHFIRVQVYLDGCYYSEKISSEENFTINYRKTAHHGRAFYYKLMQKGWSQACVSDYYMNLPDDITIEPDFFTKALAFYEPGTVLDLMNDNRDKGILKRYKHTSLCDWMDLCIMYDRSIQQRLSTLSLKPRIRKSSGVARELNRILKEWKVPVYLVNETLVHHSGHESKMNPERKEKIIS
jgi:hypothetical protein